MAGEEERKALLFSPIKKAKSPNKRRVLLHSPLSAERLISHSSIISKMLHSSLRRGPSRKQTPLNSKRPRSLSLCNDLPPLFLPCERTRHTDRKALTETNTQHSNTHTHTHIQAMLHKHPQHRQTTSLGHFLDNCMDKNARTHITHRPVRRIRVHEKHTLLQHCRHREPYATKDPEYLTEQTYKNLANCLDLRLWHCCNLQPAMSLF